MVKNSGKSQSQLARDLGMHRQQMSHYVTGVNVPRADLLCLILAACGVDLKRESLADWFSVEEAI